MVDFFYFVVGNVRSVATPSFIGAICVTEVAQEHCLPWIRISYRNTILLIDDCNQLEKVNFTHHQVFVVSAVLLW